MNTTSQHNIRPALKADIPHVARIEAMQVPDGMPEKQIAKMVSKKHIMAMVSENQEGVIVAWTLYGKWHGIIDVLRLQQHIEFDGVEAYRPLIKWLTGRVTPNYPTVELAVERDDTDLVNLLKQHSFVPIPSDSTRSQIVMRYGEL
jgi:muconolactone delta-isomerase